MRSRAAYFPLHRFAPLGNETGTVSLITSFVQDLFRIHWEIRLPNVARTEVRGVSRFFKADECERRSPPEQIYQCRLMAEQLLILSARSSPDLRGEYFELAKQWSRLAVALEKTLGGI